MALITLNHTGKKMLVIPVSIWTVQWWKTWKPWLILVSHTLMMSLTWPMGSNHRRPAPSSVHCSAPCHAGIQTCLWGLEAPEPQTSHFPQALYSMSHFHSQDNCQEQCDFGLSTSFPGSEHVLLENQKSLIISQSTLHKLSLSLLDRAQGGHLPLGRQAALSAVAMLQNPQTHTLFHRPHMHTYVSWMHMRTHVCVCVRMHI